MTRNRANERRKWYLQESNRGHTDFQSDALPTELRHQFAGAKVQTFFEPTKYFANFFQNFSYLSPLTSYLCSGFQPCALSSNS